MDIRLPTHTVVTFRLRASASETPPALARLWLTAVLARCAGSHLPPDASAEPWCVARAPCPRGTTWGTAPGPPGPAGVRHGHPPSPAASRHHRHVQHMGTVT